MDHRPVRSQVDQQLKLDTVASFTKSMGVFHVAASKQSDELRAKRDAADSSCKRMLERFGEDAKTQPEDIFSLLHNFILSFEK